MFLRGSRCLRELLEGFTRLGFRLSRLSFVHANTVLGFDILEAGWLAGVALTSVVCCQLGDRVVTRGTMLHELDFEVKEG